jgi:hypothetical protein
LAAPHTFNMSSKWNATTRCVAEKDAAGNCPSAMTGAETDGELRDLAFDLALHCPMRNIATDCPFQLLSKLTPASLQNTLAQMRRQSLLELFELERECRRLALEQNQFHKLA